MVLPVFCTASSPTAHPSAQPHGTLQDQTPPRHSLTATTNAQVQTNPTCCPCPLAHQDGPAPATPLLNSMSHKLVLVCCHTSCACADAPGLSSNDDTKKVVPATTSGRPCGPCKATHPPTPHKDLRELHNINNGRSLPTGQTDNSVPLLGRYHSSTPSQT
jgi:hypothetical protein